MDFKAKNDELPKLTPVNVLEGWEYAKILQREDREKLLSHIAQVAEGIPDRLKAVDLLCKMNKDYEDGEIGKFHVELVVSETDMDL